MRLDIERVKQCREGEAGYFRPVSKFRAVIKISEKRNPDFSEYAATLLHELLHFYTALLENEGFTVSEKREHKWIYDCEAAILRIMKKYLKRG